MRRFIQGILSVGRCGYRSGCPRTWLAGVAVFAASLAGCGPSGPAIHPVSGTVTFADGRPLTIGRVLVKSQDSKHGSYGYIRPDGSFVMGTLTDRDGVPAGTWSVYIDNALTPPPETSDPGAPPFVPQPLVHARFTTPQTSGLTFKVPDQREWKIVVEPPGKPGS